MSRTTVLAVVTCVVLTLSATAAPLGAQSDDEKTLRSCNDITEGGSYQVTEDIHQVDGSGAASCVEIRTDEEVVIEGNGYSIIGNGQNPDEDGNSYGILVSDYADVTVRDVTIENWDIGLDPGHSSVTVENAEVRDNGNGFYVNQATVELHGVRVTGNDLGLWHLVGGVETHDTEFVDNGAGGTVGDGCACHFEDTEFSRNDDYGFELRHMTRVDMYDVTVEDNGGPGVYLVSTGSRLHVEGGTVAGNGGAGIDGTNSGSHDVYLNGTSVRDNDGYEILAADTGAVVYADGAGVGDGLTLHTDGESLNVENEPVEWAATDGLTLKGEDVEATVAFTVGTEDAQLWERVDGTWEMQNGYENTGGSFQETLGAGTWAGDGAEEEKTPTPTATSDPTPTETETPTPQPTDATTTTPTDSPQESATSTPTPTPTETESRSSGSGWGGGDGSTSTETRTPTPGSVETPTRTTGAPDTPEDAEPSDTSAGTGGKSPEEATATDSETTTETDASADDAGATTDRDDDGGASMMDGPGFDPLVALLALLATALLVRRRE